MAIESRPQSGSQDELPVYLSAQAFGMFHEIATGLHHDATILGELAVEIGETFGERYDLRAPIAQSTIVYRFGSVGPFQPKSEPPITRTADQTPYYAANQLALPLDADKASDLVSTSRRAVLAKGNPIDVWTGAHITQPLLRTYLESLLFPIPANESGIALATAVYEEAESAVRNFFGRSESSRKRRDAFIVDALKIHSDAITLDLR